MLGGSEQHSCANGGVFHCAGGTRDCRDDSSLFCSPPRRGAPEQHSCPDGSVFLCAGGTRDCRDGSPRFCPPPLAPCKAGTLAICVGDGYMPLSADFAYG